MRDAPAGREEPGEEHMQKLPDSSTMHACIAPPSLFCHEHEGGRGYNNGDGEPKKEKCQTRKSHTYQHREYFSQKPKRKRRPQPYW